MTQTAVRSGALVALLVLSTGCGTSGPASPTPRSDATAAPAPSPAPPTFPPLVGNSRTFTFDHELSYHVGESTKRSRFVLYDNGAFVLQFPICNCGGEYRGRYTDANGILTFEWEGWSLAGPWGATGTLHGDALTVRYNLIMQLSDFEDAVYQRMQQAPSSSSSR